MQRAGSKCKGAALGPGSFKPLVESMSTIWSSSLCKYELQQEATLKKWKFIKVQDCEFLALLSSIWMIKSCKYSCSNATLSPIKTWGTEQGAYFWPPMHTARLWEHERVYQCSSPEQVEAILHKNYVIEAKSERSRDIRYNWSIRATIDHSQSRMLLHHSMSVRFVACPSWNVINLFLLTVRQWDPRIRPAGCIFRSAYPYCRLVLVITAYFHVANLVILRVLDGIKNTAQTKFTFHRDSHSGGRRIPIG